MATENRIPGLIEELGLADASPRERAKALPGLVTAAVEQNFTPEQWNAGSQEDRQEAINRLKTGIQEKYADVFTVEVTPATKRRVKLEGSPMGLVGPMGYEQEVEVPAVRRPIYDPETEGLIEKVRGGGEMPDFSKMAQGELLGTYGVLAQAAPERAKELTQAVKGRAKEILEDRGYPTIKPDDGAVDTFLKEFTNQGLALAGPMGAGPLVDLVGTGVKVATGASTGEVDEVMNEISLLSKDNRALATLAYGDEQQVTRFLGTTLPYLALGNAALRKLGKSAISKGGIAAQAGTSAAIGAAQGPEYVPSMLAEAAGMEPSRFTSALEAGGIDLVFGTALRAFGQSRFLNKLRQVPGFEDVRTMKQAKARYEDWRARHARNVTGNTPEPQSKPAEAVEPAEPRAPEADPYAGRNPRAEVEAKIARQVGQAVTPEN
ncbi:MAG: hypothetical protein ACQKBU_01385, partial [Verrucomicrobiales bacterium]